MSVGFHKTINIVNVGVLPKKIALSQEAQSKIGEVVTIEEARRLLGQTGKGYLAHIPLLLALINEGSSGNYKIDYKKLFQIFISNKDSIGEKIKKSYDEVMGMVNISESGNAQGVKLFAEYKKKLTQSLDGLHEEVGYIDLQNILSLYVTYLQVAYILMGRQH